MKDIVKKSFLLGLGAASITKSQAERIVKELTRKGGVNTKEGKKLLRRVLTQANKQRKSIQALAQKEAIRLKKGVNLVSKAEVNKLKSRINALEKKLHAEGKKTAKNLLRRVSK